MSGSTRKVIITATFTADPVEDALAHFLSTLGDFAISISPLGQVFQELLNPASALSQNRGGVNVVLVRVDDWPLAECVSVARELVDALKEAARRAASPIVVALCPSHGSGKDPQIAEAEAVLASAGAVAGVHFLGSDWTTRYRVTDVFDREAERLAEVPYTPAAFAALGATIARAVHALTTTPFKVVAVDADETLWGGVVGEDGVMGVVFDEPRKKLQQRLVELHDAGVLICVVSKNEEADVLEVFERRASEMPLKRQHVTSFRVNWTPKHENLASLSRELGLATDSFVFLDDNPVECAAMEAALPEVFVVQIPKQPSEIEALLEHTWAFDRLRRITAEDRKRAEHYRANVSREAIRTQTKSLLEFLKGLRLEIDIAPMSEADIERVSQLTQRTNQFNTTTKRLNEQELAAAVVPRGSLRVLTARVRDRFGDYGLVGAAFFEPRDGRLWVDNLLLSCRALGRGVEHTFVTRLAEIADAEKLSGIDIPFRKSSRNEPAETFLNQIAETNDAGKDERLYRLSAEAARDALSKASSAVAAPGPADGGASSAPAHAQRLKALREALSLRDGDSILAAVKESRAHARDATTAFHAPETPTQQALAEIWCEVLSVDRVGRDDDFFALGGSSLAAVRMLSVASAKFSVDLPLRAAFDAPTLAALAERIDSSLGGARPLEQTDDRTRAPLSYHQALWWARQERNPDWPLHHLGAYRIRGALDATAFADSVDSVLERHDVLRTVVEMSDGVPTQVIREPRKHCIARVDLRGKPGEVDAFLRNLHEEPPRMVGADLLRVFLLELSAEEHVFVVAVHRVILDPILCDSFVRQVFATYEAKVYGLDPPPAKSSFQYVDFTAWQERIIDGAKTDGRIEEIRARLRGVSPVALPFDRPAPERPTPRLHRIRIDLGAPLAAALSDVAKGEATTIFVVMSAAFVTFLMSVTGQDEIVVVAPHELTRTLDPSFSSMLGCFTDNLILRSNLSRCSTFRDVLRRQRQTVDQSIRHADIPCMLVTDDFVDGPTRRAAFNMIEVPAGMAAPISSRLEIKGLPTPHPHRIIDLVWSVFVTANGLISFLELSADRFEEESAARLSRRLTGVLEGALERPDAPLGELTSASAS